jgi:hypothetical protein
MRRLVFFAGPLGLCAALVAASPSALAQAWPSRTISIFDTEAQRVGLGTAGPLP